MNTKEKIKYMIEHGELQSSIAAATGIPQGTISRIYNGLHADPRTSNTEKISAYYDVVRKRKKIKLK